LSNRPGRSSSRSDIRKRNSRTQATAFLRAWAREDEYVPLDEEVALLKTCGFRVEIVWRRDALTEVRRAGAELRKRCDRIDVLVNNAGLIHDRRELTVDGFERTFALNHLAAFLMAYELRELLAASAPARVVTVSSFGHNFARFDWDDLATMTKWRGETAVYGASKLCNIWFAKEAARRMRSKRVTSNTLHPGAVASNFGTSGSWLFKYGTKVVKPLLLTVEKGARTSIYLASSPEVEGVTGEYFVRCKVKTPSKRARDDASAHKLWELSERLCGVTWS